MTIKDAFKTGLIGRYTLIRIYDIRSDGYLMDSPVFMMNLPSRFSDMEIYHIDSEVMDEKSYLCIDTRIEEGHN